MAVPRTDAERALTASRRAFDLLSAVTEAAFSDGARDADGCSPEQRAEVQASREAAVDAMLAYVAGLEERADPRRGGNQPCG